MPLPPELTLHLHTWLTKAEPSPLPRYKQLYEALRQLILDGLLSPGSRLPSSRVIAKTLGIARNTVITAIEQLCAEGYAITRPKSGIYILATAPTHFDTNNTIQPKVSLNLSSRGQTIAAHAKFAPMRGAFASGIPDLKQFPFELWQRYVARHARNPKLDWQANPHQGGDTELRQILADNLRITRSIRCNSSQILITHGTQRSLQLVANLLADPADTVWVEDPGYSGAKSAFLAAGLNIVGQPIDQEGLSPPLNAWQHPPKLIYTTPSHQFPTGTVMSATRRRNLLALASQHQTFVIEDDYDSEFRYEGNPLAALHALAPQQVIYLGTFSKTFFPALQIGYMVLPEPLIEAFRTTQVRHHREPPYVIQKALADFMRDGHVSAHIRKMRREYQLRRDTLVDLLQNELGGSVRLSGLDTGLHLCLHLPDDRSDQRIAEQAVEKGIMTHAISRFYIHSDTQHSPALILGFGDADVEEILRAGKILCQIIKT
ncbi:MAG TPA: PLP-dependent aminotransferase family protein [Gammaproteobacteria bacterium]|nr:PLP-dependent aminotransferase family protein [Gammaproteobacteria bacterium]